MWIVMSVLQYEFEPVPRSILTWPVEIVTDSIGYLPVYETQEQAKADYPDIPVMEIEFTKNLSEVK